jgi:hypothetical protein
MVNGNYYVRCDCCGKKGKVNEQTYLKLLFGKEKTIYCPTCFKERNMNKEAM